MFRFLDLLKEGSVATVIVGQAPFLTGEVDGNGVADDPERNFIIEGQYRYPITDNISITPGVYAIFNPENEDRDTIIVGVIRTVFKF